MSKPRAFHTAVLLSSGKVLVVGGEDADGPMSSVEVFDPALGTWSSEEALETPRLRHASLLLPSGELLVVGGLGTGEVLGDLQVGRSDERIPHVGGDAGRGVWQLPGAAQ